MMSIDETLMCSFKASWLQSSYQIHFDSGPEACEGQEVIEICNTMRSISLDYADIRAFQVSRPHVVLRFVRFLAGDLAF